MKVTCDIEVSIAGGLANFVRDDTLVDAAVCMTHRANDQAVDVTDCRRKQRRKVMKQNKTVKQCILSFSFIFTFLLMISQVEYIPHK